MKKAKLNEILKKLIDDKGVKLAQVAKATGIPASTVASYLHGKKAAYNPDHILALSDYFNVTTDFLLSGQNSKLNSLNSLKTSEVFSGWLKVKIERAIPDDEGGSK